LAKVIFCRCGARLANDARRIGTEAARTLPAEPLSRGEGLPRGAQRMHDEWGIGCQVLGRFRSGYGLAAVVEVAVKDGSGLRKSRFVHRGYANRGMGKLDAGWVYHYADATPNRKPDRTWIAYGTIRDTGRAEHPPPLFVYGSCTEVYRNCHFRHFERYRKPISYVFSRAYSRATPAASTNTFYENSRHCPQGERRRVLGGSAFYSGLRHIGRDDGGTALRCAGSHRRVSVGSGRNTKYSS
jgi:hypothetical protein